MIPYGPGCLHWRRLVEFQKSFPLLLVLRFSSHFQDSQKKKKKANKSKNDRPNRALGLRTRSSRMGLVAGFEGYGFELGDGTRGWIDGERMNCCRRMKGG